MATTNGGLKVVTSFGTLMRLAADLGKGRQSGDPERIAVAQAKRDAYRDACLESDEMVLDRPVGEL